MTTILILIFAIGVGVMIKWMVSAKEEFFEIFDDDNHNKN